MKKLDFKGKQAGVLGIGIEGEASVRWLVKHGAKVTVLDKKEKGEIDNQLIMDLRKENIAFVFGEDYLNNLQKYNIIVRSPGIKTNTSELQEAQKKGVIITSQTKLFFDLCPCPIIGVTGTKGKGTTSTLIHQMLKAQGFSAYLGGNIGEPPLNFLDKLNDQSITVLELSSFQLQDLTKSPHIAVMLMTTSEHLDYHKDIAEYVDAKRNILRFQTSSDFAVINRDYLASSGSAIHTKGRIYKVSREREIDNGCYVQDGKVWISINGKKEAIINTSDILIPGAHNFENVCAGVMAAKILHASKENIVSVLKTFKGLPHRLELVREVKGVKYYDDSFSTTPETAIAAIHAFKAPEILILGGSSKNSDFTQLGKIISSAKNIKAIIGIGVEWRRMKAQFPPSVDGSKFPIIEGAKDMKTIVGACSKIAAKGDVVLLSPACASFDMFKNYKDRGEQFRKEINKLISNS